MAHFKYKELLFGIHICILSYSQQLQAMKVTQPPKNTNVVQILSVITQPKNTQQLEQKIAQMELKEAQLDQEIKQIEQKVAEALQEQEQIKRLLTALYEQGPIPNNMAQVLAIISPAETPKTL